MDISGLQRLNDTRLSPRHFNLVRVATCQHDGHRDQTDPGREVNSPAPAGVRSRPLWKPPKAPIRPREASGGARPPRAQPTAPSRSAPGHPHHQPFSRSPNAPTGRRGRRPEQPGRLRFRSRHARRSLRSARPPLAASTVRNKGTACVARPNKTGRLLRSGPRGSRAKVYSTAFTCGIFHEPSRSEGGVVFGQ